MASKLKDDLKSWFEIFKNPSEQRQFRVLVDDETLFVCNLSFAACSPVFKIALFGDFKEKHENQFKFPEKSLNQVLEMFACFFALTECSRKQISLTNFSTLWDLANQYLIEVCLTVLFQKKLFRILFILFHGPNNFTFMLKNQFFQELSQMCQMFIDRYLKDDMTSDAISDWFKMGVFKRIFSAGRLFQFHDRVTSALKFVIFETWSSYANDVSKEVLIKILKYRDVDANYLSGKAKKSCQFCQDCCFECDKRYYPGYGNRIVHFCILCKRTS